MHRNSLIPNPNTLVTLQREVIFFESNRANYKAPKLGLYFVLFYFIYVIQTKNTI